MSRTDCVNCTFVDDCANHQVYDMTHSYIFPACHIPMKEYDHAEVLSDIEVAHDSNIITDTEYTTEKERVTGAYNKKFTALDGAVEQKSGELSSDETVTLPLLYRFNGDCPIGSVSIDRKVLDLLELTIKEGVNKAGNSMIATKVNIVAFSVVQDEVTLNPAYYVSQAPVPKRLINYDPPIPLMVSKECPKCRISDAYCVLENDTWDRPNEDIICDNCGFIIYDSKTGKMWNE